jgi:hypothetical protein
LSATAPALPLGSSGWPEPKLWCTAGLLGTQLPQSGCLRYRIASQWMPYVTISNSLAASPVQFAAMTAFSSQLSTALSISPSHSLLDSLSPILWRLWTQMEPLPLGFLSTRTAIPHCCARWGHTGHVG